MQLQGEENEIVRAAMEDDLDSVELDDSIRVLLNFVKLLTLESHKNSPVEIQKLRDAGWVDSQIAEAVLVVGMFSMFNRVADAFGLPDPNYFDKEKEGNAIVPATRPNE